MHSAGRKNRWIIAVPSEPLLAKEGMRRAGALLLPFLSIRAKQELSDKKGY
jgi:hypothetical protein